MSEQLSEEDYGSPEMDMDLYCTNHDDGCHYRGTGVRILHLEKWEIFGVNFKYLCPECFKKLMRKKTFVFR